MRAWREQQRIDWMETPQERRETVEIEDDLREWRNGRDTYI